MKRNKLLHMLILLLALLIQGCKEKGLILYNENEGGNSIYFTMPYNTALETVPSDSMLVKFSFLPSGTTSTTQEIEVAATGPIYDKDREFKVLVEPSSTLREGKHYTFANGSFLIPAGKRTGTLQLEIKKTDEMAAQRLETSFELIPNENFNINIKTRKTPNLQKDIPILKFRVMVDNINDKPYPWAVAPYKTTFENYLGQYSLAKLNILIELFNEDINHFLDPKYAKSNYFSLSKMSFWSSYMKYWLGKEASEGRIHKDENGVAITMGPIAN